MREPNATCSCDFPDPNDDDGVGCALLRALPCLLLALELIAPRAESAERFVAMPLTSLSVSSVGSRLTNSFCSN